MPCDYNESSRNKPVCLPSVAVDGGVVNINNKGKFYVWVVALGTGIPSDANDSHVFMYTWLGKLEVCSSPFMSI